MAVVAKKICDRCGKHSEESVSLYTIKGFRTIKIELGQYNTKEILVCDDCLKKVGLLEEEKPKKLTEENSVEKVFDLLAEIIAERIEK